MLPTALPMAMFRNFTFDFELPSHECTLTNVSLLEVMKIIQKLMKEFPKEYIIYSVFSANCIQLCTQITYFLKKNLTMKKNIDDPVLQNTVKPIQEGDL